MDTNLIIVALQQKDMQASTLLQQMTTQTLSKGN
jgi:hypothetical protein